MEQVSRKAKAMQIKDILLNSGGLLFLILTLIQITPLKINPWSAILKVIGKALTVDVLDKLDENSASTCRYRLIRFDDELRHDVKHTQEHFDQILDDITTYENYCKEHPLYPNSKAVLAIENIKETYSKCRKENSFL